MKTKLVNRLYYLLGENIRSDISDAEAKRNALEGLSIVNDYKRKKEEKQRNKEYKR